MYTPIYEDLHRLESVYMIRIGDFAHLAQVSIQTLRHYDDLDLLKPAHVDPANNYRYYTIEQLPQINRVLALKHLGLSLDQIVQIVKHGLTAEELRGMLKLRRSELEGELAQVQNQLEAVEARLTMIEKENEVPDHEVVIKTVGPIKVFYKRVHIPSNDLVPQYLTPAFDQTYQSVKKNGISTAGPAIAIWHTAMDAQTDEVVDAAIPIKGGARAVKGFEIEDLPAQEMACIIHEGDFADFMQAYESMFKWLEANGYVKNGAFREVYHKFDPRDTRHTVTEVQVPIARVE